MLPEVCIRVPLSFCLRVSRSACPFGALSGSLQRFVRQRFDPLLSSDLMHFLNIVAIKQLNVNTKFHENFMSCMQTGESICITGQLAHD
jgi:hypothetical protein